MRIILFLLAITLVLTNCKQTADSSYDITHDPNYLIETQDSQKLVIYQMMTRLFGNTNQTNKRYGTIEENGVGKFNDITTTALQSLKDLGVTHVWYTGVLEHATMTDYSSHGILLDDADVVKGRAGSPYAIKDYYDVNPDLATDVDQRMQEFEALLQRTHDLGLKAFIDFVPNHVARSYLSDAKPDDVADFGTSDNPLLAFSPHNNFYYIPGQAFIVPAEGDPLGPDEKAQTEDGKFLEMPAKASGNDVFSNAPSVHDWFETVKLNYGVDYQNDRQTHFDSIPDTWHKMQHILSYWAQKGVDGFRCDMAEMVPAEFWNWVIPQIKSIKPDILFLAEIYTPGSYDRYLEFGQFDYLYDKVQLYDTLKHIIQQKGSTNNIPAIWQSLRGNNSKMLRFLENHDEQRIASADFAGEPENALPAMVVSATLFTGPVMIYFGQEVGEPGLGEEGFGGEDGRSTIFDYWGVSEHQKWVNNGAFDGGQLNAKQKELRQYYLELLNFCTQNEAIVSGRFYDLQEANQNTPGYSNKVYGYIRFTENQRLLVVTNFDTQNLAAFKLKIPQELLNTLLLKNSFKMLGKFGTEKELRYRRGVDLELLPLASYIFEF